ncbi:Ser/Thr protein phosphatase [Histomonas meleagridis]|uniref:Ser/Thr protein phosphatase n=1 Tax=Histomonas meleagridis TaxID=135588 RepID=UPI00355A751F|nr:Ser/Thr protein phosphatase [Histomonas meleagridis]KAH0802825.1 Ser/Thr protein phosphatase [Histomonas meleagridis]
METKDVPSQILEPFKKYIDPEFEGFEPDLQFEKFPVFDINLLNQLCLQSIEVMKNNSCLSEIPAPVTIVGDLHGSLIDLLKILRIFEIPPQTKYLFLGDFVDRGPESLNVISIILSFMCLYPQHIFLIRGNHEFSHINHVYGFHQEINQKYNSEELWTQFQQVFNWLPLASIVQNSVFCVHGGLSPLLQDVQQLRELQLPIPNYFQNSMISDLVWSDPVDSVKGFLLNRRGSGQIFGADAVENFLKTNNLKLLIRAHQCTLYGFRAFDNFQGITLFSCSNYCQTIQNKCGVITFKDEREISFYSLDEDSDVDTLPRAIMSLPNDGIGLRRMVRTASRPNLYLPDNNDETRDKPKTMSRSMSVCADLTI